MSYDLYGVTAEGEQVQSKKSYPLAPTDNQIGMFAQVRKCAFVIRYFPSKKGWKVYDTRAMQRVRLGNNGTTYRFARIPTIYPSLDAALMTVLHRHSWPVGYSRPATTYLAPTKSKSKSKP